MSLVGGYFDWMIKDEGPPGRTNGGKNTHQGVVIHSAEGNGYANIRSVLFGSRGSSWKFTNLKDGRCFQHYPIDAQTWTSGNGYMNNNCDAWENEGVAGEPFTDKQNANNIRIIREIMELGKWPAVTRPENAQDKTAQLWEHREGVRFGGDPTACPSGRVPWQLYIDALTVKEDDDMKPYLAWDKDNKRVYLIGPFGAAWIVNADDVKTLEGQYGKMVIAYSESTIKSLGAA